MKHKTTLTNIKCGNYNWDKICSLNKYFFSLLVNNFHQTPETCLLHCCSYKGVRIKRADKIFSNPCICLLSVENLVLLSVALSQGYLAFSSSATYVSLNHPETLPVSFTKNYVEPSPFLIYKMKYENKQCIGSLLIE